MDGAAARGSSYASAARKRTARFIHSLAEPDHYVATLALSILVLLSIGFLGTGPPASLLVALLLGVNVVYAFYTSRAPRRIIVLSSALVILSLAGTAAAAASGKSPSGFGVNLILATLLVTATPVIIARRLVQHPVVNLQTITGALCVYLLYGLFFAYIYRLLELSGMHPFFSQTAHATAPDYIYFSFVTLTTLGYGDLTTPHNVARMLVITEALLGQFYLVTVIALLVGRVGQDRHMRDR